MVEGSKSARRAVHGVVSIYLWWRRGGGDKDDIDLRVYEGGSDHDGKGATREQKARLSWRDEIAVQA